MTDIDFGKCERCRFFSPLKAQDVFQTYASGICFWKWRSCSPYDAVPLVAHDSHCIAFEQRRTSPISSTQREAGKN